MQNRESLLSTAVEFLSEQLGIPAGTIDPEKDLKAMGMDSFRIIEMVLFLERKTGLAFPDTEYTPANLRCVSSIVGCFQRLEK